MNELETQVLGQLLTGVGVVVISIVFGLIGVFIKKHSAKLTSVTNHVKTFLSAYVDKATLAEMESVVKDGIVYAEKLGSEKGLSGKDKFSVAVNKALDLLKDNDVDIDLLKAKVETEFVKSKEQVEAAYKEDTEDATKKALADAQVAKQEAEKVNKEAQDKLTLANEAQKKLNQAIQSIQSSNTEVKNDPVEASSGATSSVPNQDIKGTSTTTDSAIVSDKVQK